ncbi:MAG: ATP-binding protein, partial [Treponema sp.]|nr:ATP-binding protein [Treponema sp.]
LDALAYRLEDPAIRSVMETLMTGEPDPRLAEGEAFRLCVDLGLVAIEGGTPVVANPMYREVLARQMTYGTELAIPAPEWKWEQDDGRLDMGALLREFQVFWRTNGEAWEGMTNYPEAFPHILLQAFLQRVTNGEGRIEREYAAGRGRMDLAVEYHGSWDIIEVKMVRGGKSREAVVEEGKRQVLRYRDRFSPGTACVGKGVCCYLVIFDRRPEKGSWEERLFWTRDGEVTVVGC